MAISILQHTLHELTELLFESLGRGTVQARDLYKQWIRKGTLEPPPASFGNAPRLLEEMKSHIDFQVDPVISTIEDEESKTKKLGICTRDGYTIESVILPMQHKTTLCISSQIGCMRGCSFCQTAKMGLIRNLEVREIVEQVFIAKQPIDNVVFMGMGEPLDNFDAVMKAFSILTDPNGFHIGRKNITLSTSGHVKGIQALARYEGHVPHLAVSLNAAQDEVRSLLMPINRIWNLASLKEAIGLFTQLQKREVLLAYVLLRGVNDSDTHIEALLRFIEDLPCKINLISYNAAGGTTFAPPDEKREDQIAARLRQAGHRVLVRRTKGASIMAACGQLGSSKKR